MSMFIIDPELSMPIDIITEPLPVEDKAEKTGSMVYEDSAQQDVQKYMSVRFDPTTLHSGSIIKYSLPRRFECF